MKTWCTRRVWLNWAITAMLGSASSGCGTLLYPERRGQPAGRLDWKVVGLNGIGLLFFFIPGVIAFAVDFINGTIYLPADCVDCEPVSRTSATQMSDKALRTVSIPRDQMHPAGIRKVISRETGKTISLDEGTYLSQSIGSIDEFWPTAEQLEGHSLNRPAFSRTD